MDLSIFLLTMLGMFWILYFGKISPTLLVQPFGLIAAVVMNKFNE